MVTIFALVLLAALAGTAQAATINVTCVGDSITAGVNASSPSANYPADLQALLGSGYEVENDGVPGTTILTDNEGASVPYVDVVDPTIPGYGRSLQSNPDIVIIMLGTNDTKPANFGIAGFADDFVANYTTLINTYKQLPSHPQVYACLPCYVYVLASDINEPDMEVIIPLIEQVAVAQDVPVIDVHSATSNIPQDFSDGVHPNDAGYVVLSNCIYNAIYPPVVQNITGFWPIAAASYGQASFQITGVSGGGSTNPVIFSSSNLAVASITLNTVNILGAGTSIISASQAGDAGFQAALPVAQTLTVAPAPLSVTAASVSRAYGSVNPVFSGTLTGVINGDVISATYASSATMATPVGVFGPATAQAIIPTLIDPGNRLGNYSVTTVNGTMTIDSVVLTVSANEVIMVAGSAVPPLTAYYSGFISGDTLANITTTAVLQTTATSSSGVGVYPITVSGVVAPGYYTLNYMPGILIVTASGGAAADSSASGSGGSRCGLGTGISALAGVLLLVLRIMLKEGGRQAVLRPHGTAAVIQKWTTME